MVIGIENAFTSTYHLRANFQTERYNLTDPVMLHCCLNDQKLDWDEYVEVLTDASNNGAHSSTKSTPFELLLLLTPVDPFTYQ